MSAAEPLRSTEIGEFPESWEISNLGKLFDVQQGKALSPNARRGRSPRPFLRTGNVLWGRVDLTKVDQMDFDQAEAERLALEKGDLLVCEGGEIGRTAIWGGELEGCLYQNHIHRLRRFSDEIVPEFVMYWMQAALLRLGLYSGAGNRTTIPNLSGSRLKELLVPKPAKDEQKRIADVLNTIRGAAEVQGRVVEKLKELKAATMDKVFREGLRGEPLKQTEIGEIPESWEAERLGDLCQATRSIDPQRLGVKDFRYIDVSSISSEELRVVASARVDTASAPGRARKPVQVGDVLVATVRPTLRRIALVDEGLAGSIASTAFCLVRANPKLADPRYLFFATCLKSFAVQLGDLQRGASYPAVTDGNVLDCLVPWPHTPDTLAIQGEIGRRLMEISESERRQTRRLQILNALFGEMLLALMTSRIRTKARKGRGHE